MRVVGPLVLGVLLDCIDQRRGRTRRLEDQVLDGWALVFLALVSLRLGLGRGLRFRLRLLPSLLLDGRLLVDRLASFLLWLGISWSLWALSRASSRHTARSAKHEATEGT